jgi:hypothetical protein
MTRSLFGLVVFLVTATAHAEFRIEKIHPAYGPVGPERKSWEYYPDDEILVRYLLAGVKTTEKGEVDVDITIRVLDADGSLLVEKTNPIKGVVALGGACLPGSAHVTPNDRMKPGNYRLQVKARDNLSGDTASFEREVILRQATFTSVSQRFFLDADGKVSGGAGGIVGQAIYYRIGVIGFDRSKGRIQTNLDVEILDRDGNKVLAQPIKATFKNEDADAVKQISLINFTGFFALNRAGSFTLQFTFTDPIGGQKSRFEVPLKVLEP